MNYRKLSHIEINTCRVSKIRGVSTVLRYHLNTLYILFVLLYVCDHIECRYHPVRHYSMPLTSVDAIGRLTEHVRFHPIMPHTYLIIDRSGDCTSQKIHMLNIVYRTGIM